MISVRVQPDRVRAKKVREQVGSETLLAQRTADMASTDFTELEVDGKTVRISHPGKVYFSARGETKLDLARYFLALGPAVVRGVQRRPMVMKRSPDGAEGESFYQKRVPPGRPDWLQTVTVKFPSGRSAEELCPTDTAHIVWAANLGCMDLHPWPVRREDLDHPDELRVDLDPQPGTTFEQVRETARLARALLLECGLTAFPKTSGGRGIHMLVRIQPRWVFQDVRRAALALAREAERRAPALVTAQWWKEDRGERVLLDYNQNARDRTVASAYSVRPSKEARVSCPIRWEELDAAEPGDFTLATVPARVEKLGDPMEALDAHVGSLERLLEWADRDDAAGTPDAPWPPHFKKQEGEAPRVQRSRRAKAKE